jgi:hypothetical protein
MSAFVDLSDRQKLADAALSLKAVRQYQRDRRDRGVERVKLYFDDIEGDWLSQFDSDESNASKARHLSEDFENTCT